jgi:hypothetical protein
MKNTLRWLALLTIFMQGCDKSADPVEDGLTTVSGKILDAASLIPLPGLLVVLDGVRDSTTTSGNGNFVFGGPKTEVSSITISGLGIRDTTIQLPNKVTGYDFGDILLPARAVISAEYPLDKDRIAEGFSPGIKLLRNVDFAVDRFGRSNGAIDLSGDDAQVTIEDANKFNYGSDRDFSISLWIKMPATTLENQNGIMPVVRKGELWSLQPSYLGFTFEMIQSAYNYTGSFGAGTTKGSYVVSSDYIPTLTLWHHYVVTVDRSNKQMTMYLDGGLQYTRDHPALDGHMSNTAPFIIGGKIDPIPPNNFPQFRGQIDDLRFFDGLLDSNDALKLYHEKAY